MVLLSAAFLHFVALCLPKAIFGFFCSDVSLALLSLCLFFLIPRDLQYKKNQ